MSNTERAGGGELPEGHRTLNPETGQQKAYAVLSKEERDKGFVRPYRDSYVHEGQGAVYDGAVMIKRGSGCGMLTRMSKDIAETYARDPKFYTGTFCIGCRVHLSLSEFVWDGTQERVGS